jgi:ankyrin repeat protein
MPSDPDSIYARTMDQINSQSDSSQIQLAKRVLSYLVLAKRNLSVQELIEALAIEPGATKLDSLWKRRSETLIEVCRGLVVIDDNSSIIHLAHLTLQDYLTKSLPDIEEMKKEMCLACITYLSFDVFKEGPCSDYTSFGDRRKTHAFLDYAGHQLIAHLREFNEKDIFSEEILRFAMSREIRGSYLQIHFNNLYLSETSAWHIAALLGLEAVMRMLLAKGDVDLDSKDNYGRTPLLWATREGHEAVVRLLAERDDVVADSNDRHGRTPLSYAVREGHEAVVWLLMERDDVVVDSKDDDGRTPLSYAAEEGYEAVVRLLAERDDVVADSKDNGGRTPLSYAAEEGHEAVVRLLAERDDVAADSKDNDGRTPLSYAAERGHNVLRLLMPDS